MRHITASLETTPVILLKIVMVSPGTDILWKIMSPSPGPMIPSGKKEFDIENAWAFM